MVDLGRGRIEVGPGRACEKISVWAQNGVAEAVQAGILQGFPNGTFQPQGPATRAEAAQVVARFLQYQGLI